MNVLMQLLGYKVAYIDGVLISCRAWSLKTYKASSLLLGSHSWWMETFFITSLHAIESIQLRHDETASRCVVVVRSLSQLLRPRPSLSSLSFHLNHFTTISLSPYLNSKFFRPPRIQPLIYMSLHGLTRRLDQTSTVKPFSASILRFSWPRPFLFHSRQPQILYARMRYAQSYAAALLPAFVFAYNPFKGSDAPKLDSIGMSHLISSYFSNRDRWSRPANRFWHPFQSTRDPHFAVPHARYIR